MARIRSVHPGLASDEAFMSMSMACKAAWPLLWTECDDNGVFEWKPIVLKARIFPADNVDFAAVLAELESLECIKRVIVEGKTYGIIRNFGKFQRPKNPSYRYELPKEHRLFAGFSDSPPPALPQPSGSPTENPPQMKEGGGNRGGGKREVGEERKEGSSLRSEPRARDAKPKADDDWPDDYEAQFWTLWPNKVGKPDALKSLARLRKRGVPFMRIIEGEERYIRDKPPDRPWLNPATFLNQARYDDEPAITIAKTHVFRGNADDKRTAWLAALDGKPAGPDYLDGDYEVVDPYAGQPLALAR